MRTNSDLIATQVEGRARDIVATSNLSSWDEVSWRLRNDYAIAFGERACSKEEHRLRLAHLRKMMPVLKSEWERRR